MAVEAMEGAPTGAPSRYRDREVILTPEHLREVVAQYLTFPAFAFDTETRGERPLDPRQNEVFWISLAGPGVSHAIPMGHELGRLLEPARKEKEAWYDESQPTKSGRGKKKWRTVHIPPVFADPPKQMYKSEVFKILEPLFFSDIIKVAHNFKFDAESMAKYYQGRIIPGPYVDTMVAQHLYNEREPQKGLKQLSKKVFGFEYESLGKSIEKEPIDAATRYARLDAKYTWLLWVTRFQNTVTKGRLGGAWQLDMDTLEVLMHMENRGVAVDEARMDELDKSLASELEGLRAQLYKDAGFEWQITSQPEQGKFVYEVRGHKAMVFSKKTRRPSVAAASLAAFAKKDPAVERMVKFTELTKLRSTYVTGIQEGLFNGRSHANFTLHVARTGRLSCTEPNLQNIPRPDGDNASKGTLIRGMFIAEPGRKLLVADYSQIEYRVLAHFCQDKTYSQIFFDDSVDAHVSTAQVLFGLSADEVTSEQRTIAKNTGFAVVYGAGPDKVAAMSKVSLLRAKEVMKRHRRQFPGIYLWMDNVVREARRQKPPGVETLLGRKRRLPEINAGDFETRGKAERQAVNTIVQGSAADLIKLAMVRMYEMLPEDMWLLLSVHDELVVSVPEDRVAEGLDIMREAMTGSGIQELIDVPLRADGKAVSRWSEAK